jgi:hypothetical protein
MELFNRRNKTIASLRLRLDKDRTVTAFAEDFPDLENILSKNFRIDVCLGPDRFKQIVRRNEITRVLHEKSKHVKCLGGYGYSLFFAPQTVVQGVESKSVKRLHGGPNIAVERYLGFYINGDQKSCSSSRELHKN